MEGVIVIAAEEAKRQLRKRQKQRSRKKRSRKKHPKIALQDRGFPEALQLWGFKTKKKKVQIYLQLYETNTCLRCERGDDDAGSTEGAESADR
jgi:hypothetical protein